MEKKNYDVVLAEATAYLNGKTTDGEAVLRLAEATAFCICRKAFSASGSPYMYSNMVQIMKGSAMRKAEARANYTEGKEVLLIDFEESAFFEDIAKEELFEMIAKAEKAKARRDKAKSTEKEAEKAFFSAFMKRASILENAEKMPVKEYMKKAKEAEAKTEEALAKYEKAKEETREAEEALANVPKDIRSASLEDVKADTMPEAYDIVMEVSLAIMEEAEAEKARFGSVDFLRSFEKTEVRRKVIIKEGAKEETFETTGLREVWKAGSRYINSLRSKEEKSNKIYIETAEGLYKRLPSYFSGLASFGEGVVNKAKTPYISEEEVETLEEVIASLNLTASQAQAFTLLLRGYGEKAVATRLHVSKTAIQKKKKEIAKKALLSEDIRRLLKKYNVKLEA